jgi:hypothetical protein
MLRKGRRSRLPSSTQAALSLPAWHARLVTERVSDLTLVDHEIVPGAGHFSFMSAFPPHMTRPDFPPSQDPPGFDRLTLQPTLHRDVQNFFERTLGSCR